MDNLKKLKSKIFAFGILLGALASPWQSLNAIWKPAEVVSNPAISNSPLNGPTLSVNEQGNAIAAWTDSFSPTIDVQRAISSSFYTRGIGWSIPEVISSLAFNIDDKPLYLSQGDQQIALNSSNYAVAVWEGEYAGDPLFFEGVFGAARTNGVWGPVQFISTPESQLKGFNANVAVNNSGTAVAAYRSQDLHTFLDTTLVSILPFGGSWSTPLTISDIEQGLGDVDNKPWVVINSAGDIAVVWWGRISPNVNAVLGATFDALTATWSPPVTLGLTVFGDVQNPRCAINDNGNVVAIWLNNDGIRSAFFTPGIGWGPSELIDASGDEAPTVVLDPSGNATAMWPGTDFSIRSAFKPFGGVWSAPEIIAANGSSDPFQSQQPLAVDKKGNVIADWFDENGNVLSAYRLFGQPWQEPEVVFSIPEGNSTLYQSIGLASCGFAVAMWMLSEGQQHQTLAAVNENILTPFNATQRNCFQHFAVQKIFLNIFTWSPLPCHCILKYNLYCNDKLIKCASPNEPLEFVYTKDCKKQCIFTITSTNIYGFESDRVPFILQ